MELRITGREIMFFLTKYMLWDAYLDNSGTINGGGIDLRKPGYGCSECSYSLNVNGQYRIEAWIEYEDSEKNYWELVEEGDIFKEVI